MLQSMLLLQKELFTVEFFAFMLYLGSILFQIFAYCWYGNELDLKVILNPCYFTFERYFKLYYQVINYIIKKYIIIFFIQNKSIAYAIYASNWTVISVKQRQSLSFVMLISQRGRMISFYGVCSLILDTFTWVSILKIYS